MPSYVARLSAPLLALALAAGSAAAQTPSPATPADPGWPRQFYYSGDSITIYQPQVDAWQDNLIRGHAAVAIKAPGMAEPTFGVMHMQGVTAVNKDTRLVDVTDIAVDERQVPDGGHPGIRIHVRADPRASRELQQRVARPARAQPGRQPGPTEGQVRPDRQQPARHHFSSQPSILITIDGAPKYVAGHRATRDAGGEHHGVPGPGRRRRLLAACVRRLHDGPCAGRARGPSPKKVPSAVQPPGRPRPRRVKSTC